MPSVRADNQRLVKEDRRSLGSQANSFQFLAILDMSQAKPGQSHSRPAGRPLLTTL